MEPPRARLIQKEISFWVVRELLGLTIVAGIALMIWLPWLTGKPTVTIFEAPALMWIVTTLLRPGPPFSL